MHISEILNGVSLTHIFLPTGAIIDSLDNRPIYAKPLGKYKGYTLISIIPNTDTYLCEKDTLYSYMTLNDIQQQYDIAS